MGNLLSRWRKKETTIEVLEKLDKDIDALEKRKKTNLVKQKQWIGSLILYSVLAYIFAAILFYFYYLPEEWSQRIIYSSPLLIFPFLIFFLKRFLHWYFVKRITKNDNALEELREKKKTILEDVMENETYKKAKEILEKFDPEKYQKLEPPTNTPAPSQSPQGQELRRRGVPSQSTPMVATPGQGIRPIGATPHRPVPMSAQSMNGQRPRFVTPGMPAAVPMARPILPRERTATDRVIEYLVGDGPQNRYALICSQCHSHNGMALKEEFEYLTFRCCYCYMLNEAKKMRPVAPKLDISPSPTRRLLHSEPEDLSSQENDIKEDDNFEDEESMEVENVEMAEEYEEDVNSDVGNEKETTSVDNENNLHPQESEDTSKRKSED